LSVRTSIAYDHDAAVAVVRGGGGQVTGEVARIAHAASPGGHEAATPAVPRTGAAPGQARSAIRVAPPTGPDDGAGDIPDALAAAVPAKAGAENFPVAPRFLPAVVRRDLTAIYAFARLVDDLGDEAAGGPAERERLLDLVDADIDALYAGRSPRLPLLRPLAVTIAAHDLPADPFRRLVAANRQDQRVSRYPTYADLAAYCELSANPVGALVLGVFDAVTPERLAQSDAVCTGLQLVEHWQDVAEDLARGRIYLPLEDLAAFGVDEADLAVAPAGDAVRRLMAFETARARRLLDAGLPLVASLRGTARLAVAAFVAGGRAALRAIEAADFDVLSATRRPAKPRAVAEAVAVLRGRRSA
jgi:squalene synthase HpnC